jgi:putative NADPH-quinone reductase
MARIAIVVGHPREGSYCEALGEHYARGAREGGHEAALFVTGKMKFNPILHEGFDRPQPLEPELQAAHDAILSADHLVFIFPLWLGDVPAILKGFLERVLQPDLVEPSKQKRFVRLLKGKSARIIVTMGMPGFVYHWWFRSYALKLLRRNILGWMGVKPVFSTVHGSVEAVGLRRRERWLRGARKLGRRAA